MVDCLLAAEGKGSAYIRDRGTLLIKLGHLFQGAAEWERYVTAHPQASDGDTIKKELRRVRQRLATLN